MSARHSAVAAARFGGSTIDYLLARPRAVLGTLIAGQILAVVVLALSVAHNGWVWFQGGDQIWISTTGWLLGERNLPPTELGYLWPAVEAPITRVTGPTYLQMLPVLVVAQVVLLGPIAVLCVYGLAARIGGRLLGYWAALLWVLAPFAVIPLFVDRYHERWIEQFLPQALGLTAMADFPSMVIVLAAALFVTRSLAPGRVPDAVLAGLLIGAAAALKPPNLLVAGGALLAYAIARRWREGIACGVAIAPALLVLLLWKVRGLGQIPAFALEETRLAAGSLPLAFDLNRYFDLNLDHFREQLDGFREFFWSERLVEWAPFAGLIAVLRVRRAPIAALLAGWLAAFVVVKGFSERASVESGSFWRLLMPAWPAYLLLFAAIPLLVPTLPRRLGKRVEPLTSRPISTRWIAVAAVATVLVPGLAIAASTPLSRHGAQERTVVQDFPSGNILTPVDTDIRLDVERDGAARKLTWTGGGPWRAKVFYRIFRFDKAGGDTVCFLSGGVAWYCVLYGEPIATTRDLSYVDPSAPPNATYRIGVGTNWIDDPEFGDVFAFSAPVVVRG